MTTHNAAERAVAVMAPGSGWQVGVLHTGRAAVVPTALDRGLGLGKDLVPAAYAAAPSNAAVSAARSAAKTELTAGTRADATRFGSRPGAPPG